MCYLADQLQPFGVLSLVGHADGLQPADDSQVHVEDERTLLGARKAKVSAHTEGKRQSSDGWMHAIRITLSTLVKYSL